MSFHDGFCFFAMLLAGAIGGLVQPHAQVAVQRVITRYPRS